MRAVIVELRKSRAAALADNGVVYLVDAKGRAVGQQIEVGVRRRFKKPLTWAACVAVLGAMATTGVYAAYDPYTVVSVDSETESIEYTLNRFDQVLDVRPANEASEPMAQELRGKVVLVPQKAVLFKGTVRSNLLWGDETASDEALYDALRAAQAYDFVMEKGGLDAEVAEGGKNFSGGQRQRLTIARALARRPEILILDDSASALDYATDAALRRALRALPFRPTVFIVSQRTASIRSADQIVVLDDGRVVGLGTHEELLASCEVYREIYDSQYKKEEK